MSAGMKQQQIQARPCECADEPVRQEYRDSAIRRAKAAARRAQRARKD